MPKRKKRKTLQELLTTPLFIKPQQDFKRRHRNFNKLTTVLLLSLGLLVFLFVQKYGWLYNPVSASLGY